MSSPIDFITKLLAGASPEEIAKFKAVFDTPLAAAPSATTSASTPAAATSPPAPANPEKLPVSFLSPDPISIMRPKKSLNPTKTPVAKPVRTQVGEKVKSKKRARTKAESSKAKKNRRSERIPRQPKKSGPKPPVHIDLTNSEDDSPPMKIRKTVTAKRTRRQLVMTSSSGEGSSTPSQKEDADYIFEEEELGTTSQSTAKPSSGFAPTSDSDDDIEASLGDILSRLKRAKIREGKRKVEDNVKPTGKSTPEETTYHNSEASSIFADSDIDADKRSPNTSTPRRLQKNGMSSRRGTAMEKE